MLGCHNAKNRSKSHPFEIDFLTATPARARTAGGGRSDGARVSLPPEARRRKEYRCAFGRDSDLEAFSHNPPDGSLAPLAYQPSK